jgi:hypothetical protein
MERAIPSRESLRVQKSNFGRGEGERQCRIVCRDLGDVVIASKVYIGNELVFRKE